MARTKPSKLEDCFQSVYGIKLKRSADIKAHMSYKSNGSKLLIGFLIGVFSTGFNLDYFSLYMY